MAIDLEDSFHRKRRDAEDLKVRYATLLADLETRKKQLVGRVEELQRNVYLDSQLIENAKISGIGPSRIVTLRSYGIESALDVVETSILDIPGFGYGLMANLLAWRRTVAASFRFDHNRGIPPADLQAIEAPFQAERSRLEESLRTVARELAELTARYEHDRNKAFTEMGTLVTELAQAEADLTVMS